VTDAPSKPLSLDERIKIAIQDVNDITQPGVPHHGGDFRRLLFTLRNLLAEKCNEPLTSCGTQHLAAERALRIIERHGYPGDEGWEFLAMLTDQAGQRFNAARIEQPHDDDIPF
jgi:hypothetical protein